MGHCASCLPINLSLYKAKASFGFISCVYRSTFITVGGTGGGGYNDVLPIQVVVESVITE